MDDEWLHTVRRRWKAAIARSALVWLLLPVAAHAIDPSVRLSALHHTVWRSDAGAPANIVALTQTPDGFLWLGTGGGLFRFDGVRFERIATLGGQTLLGASITALHTTQSGALVIGYRFGGLSVLQGNRLRQYTVADGLPGGNAWAFTQDADGDLWAAFTGGVARLRAGVWRTMPLDGEMLPYRTLVRDAEDNVWVTAKTGAFVWQRGATAFHRAEAALPLFPFLSRAPDGRVWAADFQRQRLGALVRQGTAFRASPDREQIPLPPTGDLHWFDTGGGLWVRTGEGLARITWHPGHGGSPTVEAFTAAQGLTGEFFSFLEDREGNVWLGTAGGLHQFTEANIRRIDLGSGVGAVGVAPADGADVWATSSSGGLYKVGASVQSFPHIAQHASHLHRDRDGVVWIGSRNGLWKIDGRRDPIEIPRPDIGDDRRAAVFAPIHAIAKDRSGALWMHLVVKGTYRRVGDRWLRQPEGPRDRIMSMGNDADGRLWIGYVDRGASRVDGDTELTFGPANGLDIGAITAIYGRGPRVWLGGQHGLALFDGTSMRTPALRGLGDTTVITGVIETASGQLWINAANGLSLIEPADWQRALADPGFTVRVQRFDANDGLLGSASQIRPLPSLVEAGDGRLWAALPSGLFVIDPAHLRRNPLAPAVIIRSLSANGRPVDAGDGTALPVGQADLRIDYTATSLTVPQRVRFRYKLEGYDTEWRDAGGRREASYTRVGPGDYVFRVIASNNDGVWNETGASLAFSVPPAYWQTRWFAALAMGSTAAALWLLYRLRVWQISAQLRRRMQARLQERERIARELHDTLIQSVTGLTLHVRAAANQVQEGTPLRERLELALTRANEVMVEGRDRVTELRLHQGASVPLETALANACRTLADAWPGPRCELMVEGTPRELNVLVSEEAERVAREALTNALRHAGARNVLVRLAYDRDALRLKVQDDGRGFPSGTDAGLERPGHFGMAGMRERAARIGGQLNLRSGDQGTTVTLCVGAATAYTPANKAAPA
ncbi:sensor histidine kinase [Rubrivivax sp. RP6-9]|uniref:sensor histidine kinase n=1 Tax=Rubrivivax sp. RP6-9 TaxID=3415750 RepID=UPI003CC5E23B